MKNDWLHLILPIAFLTFSFSILFAEEAEQPKPNAEGVQVPSQQATAPAATATAPAAAPTFSARPPARRPVIAVSSCPGWA